MSRSPTWLVALVFVLSYPRFAAAAEPSAPLCGRLVVAVLERLGGNAGSCHGSFGGQNGFRLALFAGDAPLDYEFIARDSLGRRVSFADPDQSLLLLKPTNQVPHVGGARLKKD